MSPTQTLDLASYSRDPFLISLGQTTLVEEAAPLLR